MWFTLPSGIGDSIWALTKLRAIAGNEPIDIILPGHANQEVDCRAVPFLRRFPFVRSVTVLPISLLASPITNERGRYNYVLDGVRGQTCYLIPNKSLEEGTRLEDWLPDVAIDWNIMREFDWTGTEQGASIGKSYQPFACLYLGPLAGNTIDGHNRGGIWSLGNWLEIGEQLHRRRLNVVVVGASYDLSYWEEQVRPLFQKSGLRWNWLTQIGTLEIGNTLALIRRAKCLISYQCGLGIVSHYLGVPVVMWWRPDGNSLQSTHHVCFDERMATCWTRPDYANRYMGLIYGRQSPREIMAEIDRRGWLKEGN